MKGNDYERERHRIEDRIIDRIDVRRRLARGEDQDVPITSIFEYLQHEQPAEAWILGQWAGLV